MRDRRKGFCFQTLEAMDAIREEWSGAERKSAIALYQSMTDLANRRRRDGGRDGFPASRRELAEHAGMSLPTLDKIVPEFERLGLIWVVREVRQDGLNQVNQWVLDDPGTHVHDGPESAPAGGSQIRDDDGRGGQIIWPPPSTELVGGSQMICPPPTDLRTEEEQQEEREQALSQKKPGKGNGDDVERLCELLARRVAEADPRSPLETTNALLWAEPCSRLLETYPYLEIQRVIDWATNDQFWGNGLLVSMADLERHGSRLWPRAQPWIDPDGDDLHTAPFGRRRRPRRAADPELIALPDLDEETRQAWALVDAELRKAVEPDSYEVWLAELQPRALLGGEWIVLAPDGRRRWIADHFAKVLRACASAAVGAERGVRVVARSKAEAA